MAETLESETADRRIWLTTSGIPGQRGYWESRRTEWKTATPDANAATIRQLAAEALATNRSFIATATPGAGVVTAHVKQMARQQNAIIRLILGALEGTD